MIVCSSFIIRNNHANVTKRNDKNVVFLLFRYNVVTLLRDKCLDFSGTVAIGIAAAAPELFAGVDALLGYAAYHRLATYGAHGGIGLTALLCAMGETLGC